MKDLLAGRKLSFSSIYNDQSGFIPGSFRFPLKTDSLFPALQQSHYGFYAANNEVAVIFLFAFAVFKEDSEETESLP
jgi:hypothetical protein